MRAIGPEWAGRGWSAHILATGEEDEGPFADEMRAAGYVVHHVPFRRHPGFFLDVWRFFRTQRFDVIHIHCERANFWFGLLATLAGAKVFRTVNNIFRFEGGLRLRRRVQRWLSWRLGVVCTAPGPDVIAHEMWRFGNPCRQTPYWIDERRFPLVDEAGRAAARAALGCAAGQFVLVSAGRCHDIKNHAAIIRALPLLPDNVIYLHAGGGPLEAEEWALAQRLGLDARVRMLGVVDGIHTVLAAADAFVMPSITEGLGLAAVEAQVMGIPCVLSRVEGLSELAPHSRAGEWCGLDAESIAAAVIRLRQKDLGEVRRLALLDAEDARRIYGRMNGFEGLLTLYGSAG
ncbi:Glycosyltransferase [Paramagnetospirillum magneticum AMB-1]|uniref:Glycosyltransferase n=2 Tax=Paramagnetospirillum magneticum TaxID=84159 RepID=Q2W7C7_PARM1|nr:Glycosyltransferase [Paramagnetospirillum magneticum AMB-1]